MQAGEARPGMILAWAPSKIEAVFLPKSLTRPIFLDAFLLDQGSVLLAMF